MGQTFWREMIESGEFDLRFQSFRLTRLIKNGEHSIAFREKARQSGLLPFNDRAPAPQDQDEDATL